MTTIIINDKSTGAKKMIEFLKTQSYVTIVEERIPSASLMKSINEAKTRKVTRTKNTSDLLEKLKS
ncbi:MAG TPA: hypothetical protein DCL77_20285 [Prolixibacteraceae bacterium]|jgi:hypothetical protein|nr:hypothetical protein [Prolixibacteraceae bacterium]